MEDKQLTHDIGDLVTDSFSAALALVAVVVGGAGYPLWAAVAGGGSALVGSGKAVDAYLQRRATRDQERIRRLITQDGFRHLEGLAESQDDESLDLFGEVLRNALEDDEEAKQPIYSAILDWMMVARQRVADVKVVSDSVRGLSYVEIYWFVGAATRNRQHNVHGQLLTDKLPASFSVNHMLRRLSNYGLIHVSPRFDGGEERLKSLGPTRLGGILVEHCNFEGLPTPVGMHIDL